MRRPTHRDVDDVLLWASGALGVVDGALYGTQHSVWWLHVVVLVLAFTAGNAQRVRLGAPVAPSDVDVEPSP